MKFLVILMSTILPALAATVSVGYDPTYDNGNTSLSTVACSDGSHGLEKRYHTFGRLPNFPRIGGVPAVTGWNSPACGTCWKLTYTDDEGHNKTVNILAVDTGREGFNIAQAAMDELTGDRATELGRVKADAIQVNASACKM